MLLAVALGDRSALQILYARWASRILAYAKGVGLPGAEGEKMLEEAFLTLWRKACQYRRELGAPEAWIFSLVRQSALDALRRCQHAEGVDIQEWEGWQVREGKERGENRPTVAQVLDRLPSGYRRTLQMAYFGSLSYEEAAMRLGLPVATFKSRMRTALGQLRGMLEGAP